MPIEIKELVIRAVLGSADAELSRGDGPGGPPGAASAQPPVDTEQIVQDCVRQVLRILARQQER
jgi:hypothetical protein